MIRYEIYQVREGGKRQWRWRALSCSNGQNLANGSQAIYSRKRIMLRLKAVCNLPTGKGIRAVYLSGHEDFVLLP